MTVNTTPPVIEYTSDGATLDYSFPFQTLNTTWITVIEEDLNDPPNQRVLVQGAEYTVSLNVALDDQGNPVDELVARSAADGSVHLVTPITNGFKIIIQRATPLGQWVTYPRNGPFPAKTHEYALDYLSMQISDLSLKGISDGGTGVPPNTVTSVFGRPGPSILAQTGDYNSSQVLNSSGVTGTSVTEALDNLAAADGQLPPSNSITNAILADMPGYSIKMNLSASLSDPTDAKMADLAVKADPADADWVLGFDQATGQPIKFARSTWWSDVPNGLITTDMIADQAITTPKLADQSVTIDKMAANSVGSTQLVDASVITTKIADDNVTEPKIANGAVTNGKLGADAVDGTKIADDAVASEHLAANAVDNAAIAPSAVGTNEIQNGAVTSAKLAADLDAGDILAPGSVGTTELADNSVTTPKIADGNVTTAKLAVGAVDGNVLAPNAVQSSHIAAGAVGNTDLANNAVSSSKLQDGAVSTAKLATNAVDSDKLADNAVDTSAVQNGAITNQKLATAAAYSIKGNASSSSSTPTDLQRSSFGAAVPPVAGDWAIGWKADGTMVTYDVGALGGDTGLDPDANEVINVWWGFAGGIYTNILSGYDPDNLGHSQLELQANVMGFDFIDPNTAAADSAWLIRHQELLDSYVANPAAPALNGASLNIGSITDTGAAEVTFSPVVPAYTDEDSDDSAAGGSYLVAASPAWTNITGLSLTLTEDLTPGSIYTVIFDAQSTSQDDTLEVQILQDGASPLTVGTVILEANVTKPYVISHTITGTITSGTALTLRMRHTNTAGGNQAEVFANVSSPIFLRVFKPASGGGGEANDAANVGAGAGQVYRDKIGTTINLKTLRSSDGSVVISNEADTINLVASGAGGGEPNDGTNIGAGTGIFAQKNGVNLEFKSLTVQAPIQINATATEVDFSLDMSNIATLSGNNVFTGNNTFNNPVTVGTPTLGSHAATIDYVDANGGKNNTGLNIGGGTGVYSGMNGDVLEFLSLLGGTNISISSSATEITFNWSKPTNIPEVDQDYSITGSWDFPQIVVSQVPVSANQVVRKAELDLKVDGPGTAVGGNIATFSGGTGKIIQDSGFAPTDFLTSSDLNDFVVGPASAVDGNVAVYDGATGLVIKDTGVALSSLLTSADLANYVQGPGAAVDNRIAVFNGTSGKIVQDGGLLISDLATVTQLNGKVSLDGDTLTGFLTLHSDPTANLHAVTKQYVDNNFGAGDVTGPASSTDGNLAVFSGTTGKIIADGPDPNSFALGTDLNNYLPLTGGTVTGHISRAADPTNDNHLARKSYVDQKVPKAADNENVNVAIAVVATLPGTPDPNTLYFVTTAP